MYSFVVGQKSFFILAVHTNTTGGGPEMAKVELKQPIIDEIKAQLEGAGSIVVVDYRGITVAQDTELRRQCREAGVVYKVYKKYR